MPLYDVFDIAESESETFHVMYIPLGDTIETFEYAV